MELLRCRTPICAAPAEGLSGACPSCKAQSCSCIMAEQVPYRQAVPHSLAPPRRASDWRPSLGGCAAMNIPCGFASRTCVPMEPNYQSRHPKSATSLAVAMESGGDRICADLTPIPAIDENAAHESTAEDDEECQDRECWGAHFDEHEIAVSRRAIESGTLVVAALPLPSSPTRHGRPGGRHGEMALPPAVCHMAAVLMPGGGGAPADLETASGCEFDYADDLLPSTASEATRPSKAAIA
mmetsp:Transcript_24545/g.53534  ORF Transcript_24545/g.53534 Transcript_24545/m.53534 type:complete len:240 (+) Transcript_24545:72-791(+)